MIAFILAFIILVAALAASALVWLLGAPEPACPTCGQPLSLCEGRGGCRADAEADR